MWPLKLLIKVKRYNHCSGKVSKTKTSPYLDIWPFTHQQYFVFKHSTTDIEVTHTTLRWTSPTPLRLVISSSIASRFLSQGKHEAVVKYLALRVHAAKHEAHHCRVRRQRDATVFTGRGVMTWRIWKSQIYFSQQRLICITIHVWYDKKRIYEGSNTIHVKKYVSQQRHCPSFYMWGYLKSRNLCIRNSYFFKTNAWFLPLPARPPVDLDGGPAPRERGGTSCELTCIAPVVDEGMTDAVASVGLWALPARYNYKWNLFTSRISRHVE